MTTVPEPPDNAEKLATALYDNAKTNMAGAAVTLLCDIPGHLYADPEFMRRYITAVEPLTPGDRLAEVNWPKLGGDLIAGSDFGVALSHGERSLLMIAASIGGGPAVHLHALLGHLDRDELNLVVGALQRAGGIW